MKKFDNDFVLPTGPLAYNLTNDYMFKAFLQRNESALRGLVSALLRIDISTINSISIMNPIELGSFVTDKIMILDIKLMLNDNQIINIEMQVDNLGDWEERSLTYLCRAFDHLESGYNYKDALKTVQIGILNFTPKGFPEKLYLQYNFQNKETGHIYSDKLTLFVLQLNQLGDVEDEKIMPDLYYWAQLFKATTWEEIAMLAEKNESIKEGIVTLKQLTDDEKFLMQCEARERYRRDLSAATELGVEQGLQQGIEQGLQQGMEQGIQQGMEQGLQQGMEQGLQQGMDIGTERMAKLVDVLLKAGKTEDLNDALLDEKVRLKLFEEYSI
ncbi:MAG: Rpn family recombination-promoting nuclease/putative transposase [Lachnospiraceae bacterium]|nr:Rpn family recombination-promoting nuclease/putative transposase [Lachnospiraceae bacterium]